jgi:hypothetical protein
MAADGPIAAVAAFKACCHDAAKTLRQCPMRRGIRVVVVVTTRAPSSIGLTAGRAREVT